MRFKNLVYGLLLLFITINVVACKKQTIPTASVANNRGNSVSSNMVKDILMYVNQHRKSVGLAPLQLMDAATTQSVKHSADMAFSRTTFGHDGFDDRMSSISKSIGQVSAMAENVAYGHLSAKEVVDLWINSPPHKKNMEGNYNFTGIGLSQTKDGTIFFTQIFIRK